MSKLATILKLIEGSHVMGKGDITDYYAAKTVRDACRMKDACKRFNAIKLALHPYRVIVQFGGENVTIRRNDTAQSITL